MIPDRFRPVLAEVAPLTERFANAITVVWPEPHPRIPGLEDV